MTQLLIVEDDEALVNILLKRFTEEGFQVQIARTAAEALERLRSGLIPSLALIDIGLPDEDGFLVARELTNSHPSVPFVFLTAMASPEYRLEGYELGARDYIPKPFHFKELLLRVNRILEKSTSAQPLSSGPFTLRPETRELSTTGGDTVQLTEREFKLLYRLIEKAPRIISRNEVLEELWGIESGSTNSRAVDNAILRIRQAIGENHSNLIRSVRGAGYQWVQDGDSPG